MGGRRDNEPFQCISMAKEGIRVNTCKANKQYKMSQKHTTSGAEQGCDDRVESAIHPYHR